MICNLYTLVGHLLIESKQGHVKHELLVADHRQFGIVVVVGHHGWTKTIKSTATLFSNVEEFDAAGESAVNRPTKHFQLIKLPTLKYQLQLDSKVIELNESVGGQFAGFELPFGQWIIDISPPPDNNNYDNDNNNDNKKKQKNKKNIKKWNYKKCRKKNWCQWWVRSHNQSTSHQRIQRDGGGNQNYWRHRHAHETIKWSHNTTEST